LSCVALEGTNAFLALAILLLGFLITYPSALTENLLSEISKSTLSMLRLAIWAIAVIAAFAVFVFAGPLKKIESNNIVSGQRYFWFALVRYALPVFLLLHFYVLYRAFSVTI
jgi:hypothetical protein